MPHFFNTLYSFIWRWNVPSFLQNNFYLAASFTATYPALPGGNSVFWDDDIAYNKVQCTLALLSSQSSGAASAKTGLSPTGSTEMGMAQVGHSFTPKWVDDAQPWVCSISPWSVKQNITHRRPCQGHQRVHWSGYVPSEWEIHRKHAWATDQGSIHNGSEAGGQLYVVLSPCAALFIVHMIQHSEINHETDWICNGAAKS